MGQCILHKTKHQDDCFANLMISPSNPQTIISICRSGSNNHEATGKSAGRRPVLLCCSCMYYRLARFSPLSPLAMELLLRSAVIRCQMLSLSPWQSAFSSIWLNEVWSTKRPWRRTAASTCI